MTQNAISRLENPFYGKQTLTTLKRLAKTFDVGLVVRFVPFSEMVDWVTGTPRTVWGLSGSSLNVPSFQMESPIETGATASAEKQYESKRPPSTGAGVAVQQRLPLLPHNVISIEMARQFGKNPVPEISGGEAAGSAGPMQRVFAGG